MTELSLCRDVNFQISLARKRKGESEPQPLALQDIVRNVNDSRRAFANVHGRFWRMQHPEVTTQQVESAVKRLVEAGVIELRDQGYRLLQPYVIQKTYSLPSARLEKCSSSSNITSASTASSAALLSSQ